MSYLLLLHGASQVVQVTTDPDVHVLVGDQMKQMEVLRGGGPYSLLVGLDGRILEVGTDAEVADRLGGAEVETRVDATGCVLVPGLVDGHTHPVWAGDRVDEFAMKLAGASYLDLHRAGKGIHYTVAKTREASAEELWETLKERVERMIGCGTTLVEAKSGYGLETSTELKQLEVLERADNDIPGVEISATFCGAHAVPVGRTAQEATADVIQRQLPAVQAAQAAGKLRSLENADVFCEQGNFSKEQTREILTATAAAGLAANFHGDELSASKSAELAGDMKIRAISHLEQISLEGIQAMAASETVAVVLPTTAYILHLPHPPVRPMIQAGVPVALGSDFNPNAYCYSMPLVMHLACVLFGMSMEEALVGATLNAAASLNRGSTHGALAKGRVGDVLVVAAPRWEHLIYQMACQESLIKLVIKRGHIVHKREIGRTVF